MLYQPETVLQSKHNKNSRVRILGYPTWLNENSGDDGTFEYHYPIEVFYTAPENAKGRFEILSESYLTDAWEPIPPPFTHGYFRTVHENPSVVATVRWFRKDPNQSNPEYKWERVEVSKPSAPAVPRVYNFPYGGRL